MPKVMPASSCGMVVQINATASTRICCCETDGCNDAAFVEACSKGTAPTQQPPGFSCNGKVIINGEQDGPAMPQVCSGK